MAVATTTLADQVLTGLDDAQIEAALALDGPVLIVAGAGSGKTRVLTARVSLLLDRGVRPSSILCVTFTNKATAEMQERIRMQAGAAGEGVIVGTFHALCSMLLHEYGNCAGIDTSFTVAAEAEAKMLLTEAARKVGVNFWEHSPDVLAAQVSSLKRSAKRVGVWAQQLREAGTDPETVATYLDVARAYKRKLRSCNKLDFDDLMAGTIAMLKRYPDIARNISSRFRYISVDEYQDTSPQAAVLLKFLSSVHRNLCVVGDPRQSIYSFNGADPRLIGRFAADYRGTRRYDLAANYRSCRRVVDRANHLMAHSQIPQDNAGEAVRRVDGLVTFDQYGSDDEETAVIAGRITELVRREGYSFSDIAVLFRVRYLSHGLESGLLRAGTPYISIEQDNNLHWPEIKCAVSYLKMVEYSDDTAALRALSGIAHGLDRTTEAAIRESASSRRVNICTAILDRSLQISGHALTTLNKCRSVLSELIRLRLCDAPIGKMLDCIIRGVLEHECFADGKDVGIERLIRLKEFANMVATEFSGPSTTTLAPFLKWADGTSKDSLAHKDGVRLMTIHQSKGLEFPVVFLVGLEEGILPHIKSLDDPVACEEERRLAYVAMTRAKDALYMSSAGRRMKYGQIIASEPSRFVYEALGS